MAKKKSLDPATSPHSAFGPSKASRWLYCTASITEEAGWPDSTSKFATEGSCAHRLAELCLLDKVKGKRRKPSWYLGKTCDETGLAYTQEMIDAVMVYLSVVYSEFNPEKDRIYVEVRLDGSDIDDRLYGTVDCLIVKPRKLVVIDFKYGKGIAVHAEENEQMLTYALMSFLSTAKRSKFTQHIVQPRLDDPAMRHTKWDYDRPRILDFQDQVVKAIWDADNDPKFSPGEKRCHFCRASSTCKALANYNMQVMAQDFEVIEDDLEFSPVSPDKLTEEQLTAVLRNKKLIVTWLNTVEAYAIDRLQKDSRTIPEYKVVHGRSLRKWRDDIPERKLVKKILKIAGGSIDEEALHKVELLSVAQIEKLLAKPLREKLKSLWTKPEGKPTLVPVTDGRKGISSLDDYE